MLTKTDFMKYIECPVGLWMKKHKPDLIPEDTPGKRRILEIGREVDVYSQKLFAEGVMIDGYNREGWRNTQKAMASSAKILFQPTVIAGDLTCRADILEKAGSGWAVNEVKSATAVKKEYPYDVAFQKICFENAGIKIIGSNLIHINNQYIRSGPIEPEKLFMFEDISEAVSEKVAEVKKIIPRALNIIERREVPDEAMLESCPRPRTCEYLKIYLDFIGRRPEPSKIEEVTDAAGIGERLAELKYPLHFLDYETYSSAIPPFNGARPYQNIPFQYSLFVKEKHGADPKHAEFLAREFENPVPALLAQLKRDIGNKGSVIVWNESFEKGCNEEMARMESDSVDFLNAVNDRIFDLMIIFKFKNQLYVRSEFEKSASLKKVLPVICPNLSYQTLAIQEGEEASLSWPVLTGGGISESEKNKLARDMLIYCKRDTEAMVCILEKLEKEISAY